MFWSISSEFFSLGAFPLECFLHLSLYDYISLCCLLSFLSNDLCERLTCFLSPYTFRREGPDQVNFQALSSASSAVSAKWTNDLLSIFFFNWTDSFSPLAWCFSVIWILFQWVLLGGGLFSRRDYRYLMLKTFQTFPQTPICSPWTVPQTTPGLGTAPPSNICWRSSRLWIRASTCHPHPSPAQLLLAPWVFALRPLRQIHAEGKGAWHLCLLYTGFSCACGPVGLSVLWWTR